MRNFMISGTLTPSACERSLDRDAGLDGDGTGRRHDRRLRPARCSRVGACLALLARVRTLRALVDDDTPAPPRRAAAAARAERTIWFASVSHLLLQCKDAAVRGRFGRVASGHARTVAARLPARSTRCRGMCTRRDPARSALRRERRRGPRTGSGHAADVRLPQPAHVRSGSDPTTPPPRRPRQPRRLPRSPRQPSASAAISTSSVSSVSSTSGSSGGGPPT